MKQYTNTIQIKHKPGIGNPIHLYSEFSDFDRLIEALNSELSEEISSAKQNLSSNAVFLREKAEVKTDFSIFKVIQHYRENPSLYEKFLFEGKAVTPDKSSNFMLNTLSDFWRLFMLAYTKKAVLTPVKSKEELSIDLIQAINESFGEVNFTSCSVEYEVGFQESKLYFLDNHSEIYFLFKELGVIEFIENHFVENKIYKTIVLTKNSKINCY